MNELREELEGWKRQFDDITQIENVLARSVVDCEFILRKLHKFLLLFKNEYAVAGYTNTQEYSDFLKMQKTINDSKLCDMIYPLSKRLTERSQPLSWTLTFRTDHPHFGWALNFLWSIYRGCYAAFTRLSKTFRISNMEPRALRSFAQVNDIRNAIAKCRSATGMEFPEPLVDGYENSFTHFLKERPDNGWLPTLRNTIEHLAACDGELEHPMLDETDKYHFCEWAFAEYKYFDPRNRTPLEVFNNEVWEAQAS